MTPAGWLLDRLSGGEFILLAINGDAPASLEADGTTVRTVRLDERSDAVRVRYLGSAARGIYLIRPDQHVAARWMDFDETAVRSAVRIATGRGEDVS